MGHWHTVSHRQAIRAVKTLSNYQPKNNLKKEMEKKKYVKTEKHRKHLSESAKGKPRPWLSEIMKGENNPSKRPEVREKIRQSKLGQKNGMWKKEFSIDDRKKIGEKWQGEKNPNWKGGISRNNITERQLAWYSIEYKLWRKSVFVRDNFTCQLCREKGGKLHAHHIKSWRDYPELRYAIDNGRTLCIECHKKTDTYGFKTLRRTIKRQLQGVLR